jgi:hypothetical protein
LYRGSGAAKSRSGGAIANNLPVSARAKFAPNNRSIAALLTSHAAASTSVRHAERDAQQ